MKKIIRYGMLILTAVLACLLSGCGGEEKQRIGVDGYAYAGETIEKCEYNGAKRFTVAGDYLYYLQGTRQVKRIALEEFFSSGSLSGGETVFTVEDVLSATGGTEDVEAFRAADAKWKNVLGMENLYMVGIWDYAVDGEGNVYGILVVENRFFPGDVEDSGGDAQGLLCKQYADREIAYRTRLPGLRILDGRPDWLALDNGGRAYVLTAQAVVAVDADGAVKESLPVELAADEYDMRGVSGRLLEGSNGAVYYVTDALGGSATETYLLNEGETLRLTPVSFLSARSGLDLHEGMDGILRLDSEGLCRCDVAGNTMEEILKWGDSNLLAEDILAVAQVAEDRYLVDIPALLEKDGEMVRGEEKRLLSRTPVEELPEREIIVVASRYPSQDLRRCAVEFNRANDTYHVSIENYGGEPEGAAVRLDADLVSRDAPDILDFTGLDVSKYAEREMLEDLSPCLEGDGQIRREDYLGNLLEGYTIKGRLVCIPKKFNAWVFWWLPQDTGGQGSWGMEDFMALAEQYPDRRTFSRDPSLFGTEYLLGQFCAPYYLKRFVDWEAGTCSFDSEAFCRLLSWVAAQDRKDGLAQEALLGENQLNFGLYEYNRIRYGGDTAVMHGYPLAEGKEVYLAEAEDALGILAGSEHKDGAWEFLRYFLLDPGDENALPTRKALLEEIIQKEMEEDEPNSTHNYYINGVPVEVPLLQEEHAALVMQVIESIDFTPRTGAENDIVDIVWEEAQYLLDGSRTAEEAAAVIQNRAELILQER